VKAHDDTMSLCSFCGHLRLTSEMKTRTMCRDCAKAKAERAGVLGADLRMEVRR